MHGQRFACNTIEAYAIDPAVKIARAGPARHLIIVPPVCGLAAPLDTNLRSLAVAAAEHHEHVQVVEFPGQNGRMGEFSVADSCAQLTRHAAAIEPARDIRLVGLCSGATACLYAATHLATITHVLAWEVSPRYRHDRAHRKYCEKRFRIRICDQTFLSPVQPIALAPRLRCRVAFARGDSSSYCDERGQVELADAAFDSVMLRIPGLSHFLDGPEGRRLLLRQLLTWIDREATSGACRFGAAAPVLSLKIHDKMARKR